MPISKGFCLVTLMPTRPMLAGSAPASGSQAQGIDARATAGGGEDLAIVRECASQDVAIIPDGTFDFIDQSQARARAEQLFGTTLPWPSQVPGWAAQYDVSLIVLYSPHSVDGDPKFVDALRDRRTGVVVSFRDETRSKVMRIRYAPVPECQTIPVYFATPGGVPVTYTFESNIDDRDGGKYDLVIGEFSLPTTFVHLDLVYAHPNVPSEASRGIEFVSWAASLIAAAPPR